MPLSDVRAFEGMVDTDYSTLSQGEGRNICRCLTWVKTDRADQSHGKSARELHPI
jgi:hypothetical protein